MRGSKLLSRSTFLERRRSRQGRDGSARARAYSFELAALHLQLLVAMAAIDEEVRSVEVEEVLTFIDKPSLGADEVRKLEQLARESLQNPPALESLLGKLSQVARKPAIARQLVDDLARVAAADSREDPRETRMLETVCDALEIERVEIRIAAVPAPSTGGARQHPPAPRGPRIVTRHRTRNAVRQALEASYRDGAERDS